MPSTWSLKFWYGFYCLMIKTVYSSCQRRYTEARDDDVAAAPRLAAIHSITIRSPAVVDVALRTTATAKKRDHLSESQHCAPLHWWTVVFVSASRLASESGYGRSWKPHSLLADEEIRRCHCSSFMPMEFEIVYPAFRVRKGAGCCWMVSMVRRPTTRSPILEVSSSRGLVSVHQNGLNRQLRIKTSLLAQVHSVASKPRS